MLRLLPSVVLSACVLAAAFGQSAKIAILKIRDSQNSFVDPFSSQARVRVFLFVRTDCPITNRYAPELQQIAAKFSGTQTDFWLVYPDPHESVPSVEKHREQYKFPGTILFDPKHQLVALSHATVAPEAAVFDRSGKLIYHGRIDDRYVSIGKSRPGGPQTHDLEEAITHTLNHQPVLLPETRAVGCSLGDIQ